MAFPGVEFQTVSHSLNGTKSPCLRFFNNSMSRLSPCGQSEFDLNLNLKTTDVNDKVTNQYYSSCIAYKWILPTAQECDQLQSRFSPNSYCISWSKVVNGLKLSEWHRFFMTLFNYIISLPLILCQAKFDLNPDPECTT